MTLEGLNSAQAEAVQHRTGPCRVTAGAGSGKTRVLTLRVAALMSSGVEARHILVMTFTKKAAKEMRDRIDTLIGGLDTLDLTCGTIHAICYRLLREQWSHTGEEWEVLAGYAQKRLFRDLLAAPGPKNPHGLNWDIDLKLAMSHVSRYQNALVTPDQVAEHGEEGTDPRWAHLYQNYTEAKDRQGFLDLDDMLVWTVRLLRENPEVRDHWQQQWHYVLVDEVQDNNLAQWSIVDQLAAPQNNLFVVGDVDQSIFGFRGAHPDLLLDFETRYPGTRRLVLDTNYRSLPYVVTLGNRLINWNPRPTRRETRPARTGLPDAPICWYPADEDDEAAEIVGYVQARYEAGDLRWSDIGVLYRTHAQSQPIEDALVRARIPYRILGGLGFWARKEVKDVLAYLRLIEDPQDQESYARAIMAPSRYLGKVFVSHVVEYARTTGVDLIQATARVPAKPYQQDRVRGFLEILHEAEAWESPADRLDIIRDLSDYDAYFLRNDADEEDSEERLANLTQCMRVARQFATTAEFLAHVDRVQSQSVEDEDTADHVTLLTIHRAKGLEWHTVMLPGLVQGVLPHKHALAGMVDDVGSTPELEEERRLAYVAVTRAQDVLILSAPESRLNKPTEPSQFLDEMGLGDPSAEEIRAVR